MQPASISPASPLPCLPLADARYAMGAPCSPLVLADRLITLAQAADLAGFPGIAIQLVALALAALDEPTVQ